MTVTPSRLQKLLFTVVVTSVSRYFLLRDHLNGRLKRARTVETAGSSISRQKIYTGRNTLDAVFVQPASHPPKAALLLCHGIGETVDHWRPVQHLLAQGGVASLVFDYSGFGSSSGSINASQCEADTLAAFQHLKDLTPNLPLSILGFSLGSGVASAILPKIAAQHLILCAAFTSLQDAGRRIGIPARLTPPIWNTTGALRVCKIPVLILHGDCDRLFPAQMAEQLHNACASPARLVIFPELSHEDPYYRPQAAYWRNVIDALIPPSPS